MKEGMIQNFEAIDVLNMKEKMIWISGDLQSTVSPPA